MNKRMQELAEQANEYADLCQYPSVDWFSAFKEKLAELVVREFARDSINITCMPRCINLVANV